MSEMEVASYAYIFFAAFYYLPVGLIPGLLIGISFFVVFARNVIAHK
jgi:hypothetical protein